MAEKRSAFKMFLNTTPKETSADYNIIGPGVKELTISYNPQSSTEQYIHEDTATTEMTGYQPNAPVSAQAVKDDPTFEFINQMRKDLPVGSDAHTDVVLVDVFGKQSSGAYEAIKQPVSIQIDSYGGAASDPLSISYTLNWRGSGTKGTFNPSTRTFTEGAA